jgi:hypothetical protein
MKTKKEIKNIKIDPEVHEILKKYCDKRGMKIYKFLENLIIEKCKEKKGLRMNNIVIFSLIIIILILII